MKKLLIVLGIIFMASTVYADSYLLIDKQSKEVKSLSPIDDAQLQEGWEKIIIPMEFKDIELSYNPIYYKWKNNKFVANLKKLSDGELEKEKAEDIAAEEAIIQKRMRKNAIAELKAEGVTFKHAEE